MNVEPGEYDLSVTGPQECGTYINVQNPDGTFPVRLDAGVITVVATVCPAP